MRIKRRATIDAGAYCTSCGAWSATSTVFFTVSPGRLGFQDMWLCMPCARHIAKAVTPRQGKAP